MTFLLDTNVVSELRKGPRAHARVRDWFQSVDDGAVVVVAPRLVVGLTGGQQRAPLGPDIWRDTCIIIPDSKPGEQYRNILTEQTHFTGEENEGLLLAEVVSQFPVALLERFPG